MDVAIYEPYCEPDQIPLHMHLFKTQVRAPYNADDAMARGPADLERCLQQFRPYLIFFSL